jgi:hypothetical protein
MSAAFPLILTFSLREKEQRLGISVFARVDRAVDHLSFAKTLETFPFALTVGEKIEIRLSSLLGSFVS